MLKLGATLCWPQGVLTANANVEYNLQITLEGEGIMDVHEAVMPAACSVLGEGSLSIISKVFYVLNIEDIQSLTIDLSDREIYNDIRSQIDVSTTETIIDADAEYATEIVYSADFLIDPYEIKHLELVSASPVASNIRAFVVYANGASYMTEAECDVLHGHYGYGSCIFSHDPAEGSDFIHASASGSGNTVYVTVTNLLKYGLQCQIGVKYSYLVSPEQSHEETTTETLSIRETDPTSIAKYGRRVMSLTWPLGQTQVKMQEIVDLYLARHKEPVSFVNITLLGKRPTLEQWIVESEINDLLGISCPSLIDDEFWLNNITCQHDVTGKLEATFDLEQIRDMEK